MNKKKDQLLTYLQQDSFLKKLIREQNLHKKLQLDFFLENRWRILLPVSPDK